MNVARITMGTINNKEHKVLIDMIKKACKLNKAKCGILLDLQGSIIRTGELKDKLPGVFLKAGQEFKVVCKKKILGDETFTSIDYGDLPEKLKVGDHIICDFGNIVLKVTGFESEFQFLQSKVSENDKMKINV